MFERLLFWRASKLYKQMIDYKEWIQRQKLVIVENEKKIAEQKQLVSDIPTQVLPRFVWKRKNFKFGILPNFSAIRDNWRKKRSPEAIVYVNFELNNGKHLTFLAKEKKRTFMFRDKTYAFDVDSKYFNISSDLWNYDFHEDISLPIKRVINATAVKDAVIMSNPDLRTAINPKNLKEVLDAKLVEGIVRGAGLADEFRKLFIVGVVTLVAVIIHLLLYAWKSGIFQRATGQ